MSPLVSSSLLLGKPDAFLVALARRGNDAAFAAIVARYRAALERHCRRFLPAARAEDAVQQTFIRAMQALRRGEDVRELRPWLYRISRNVALDDLDRRGWDYDELHDTLEDPRSYEDAVEQREDFRETMMAVAALPERQRTALIRSAIDGARPAVIAAELGVSEGAARQLVHRARSFVRAAAAAILPPPLIYFSRRLGEMVGRMGPAIASAPAAPRVLAVVAASVGIAAPMHYLVTHGSARAEPLAAAAPTGASLMSPAPGTGWASSAIAGSPLTPLPVAAVAGAANPIVPFVGGARAGVTVPLPAATSAPAAPQGTDGSAQPADPAATASSAAPGAQDAPAASATIDTGATSTDPSSPPTDASPSTADSSAPATDGSSAPTDSSSGPTDSSAPATDGSSAPTDSSGSTAGSVVVADPAPVDSTPVDATGVSSPAADPATP